MVFLMFKKIVTLLLFGEVFVNANQLNQKPGNQKSAPKPAIAKKEEIPNRESNNKNMGTIGNNVLKEACKRALEKNKKIQEQKSAQRLKKEGRNRELAAFHPTVEATADAKQGKGGSSNSGTSNSENSNNENSNTERSFNSKAHNKIRATSWGLKAGINLWRGGADIAALKEVDLQITAGESELTAEKQKLLKEVVSLYFEILSKQQEIEHLKAYLKSREESLKTAKEMYKTGAGKRLDVVQAEAGCAETSSKLEKTKAEYTYFLAEFEETTGYKLPQQKLPELKMIFDVPKECEQAIALAIRNNPRIIAAESNVAAGKAALSKPNARMLPRLDLSWSCNNTNDHGKKKEETFWEKPSKGSEIRNGSKSRHNEQSVNLALVFPIYDGGIGISEKKQARENLVRLNIEKERIMEEVQTTLIGLYAMFKAAEKNLIFTDTIVQARRIAVYDTKAEYKAGTKTMADLLKEQQEFFESLVTKANAQKEFNVLKCKISSEIGKLAEKLGIDERRTF
jgi:outer membrane protein